MNKEEVAKKIAGYLLEIEAVKLSPNNPFQWSSGWNSPVYCDNRLALSYPEIRSFITKQLAVSIKEKFADVEAIAGVATAGIPQGALVAAELGLPFLYVRSKPKGHGMTNVIEGKITVGQKVVVLEDLISTGGSSLKAVEDLRKVDMNPIGMASIFTYGFKEAEDNFNKHQVELLCLSSYEVMIEMALMQGLVQNEDVENLKNWRKSPATWGK